jgi:hypothetical protein
MYKLLDIKRMPDNAKIKNCMLNYLKRITKDHLYCYTIEIAIISSII